MKTQGLIITLGQLTKLKEQLLKEELDLKKELGFENTPVDYGREFQIRIINKTPECLDTWEIEDLDKKSKDYKIKVERNYLPKH